MKTKNFKMTEFGHVPKDWEVVDFDECFDLLRTNTYARAYMTDSEGVVNNVHYGDVLIKYGNMLDFNKGHVPYLVGSIDAGGDFLGDGDVVVADTAEDETVGKATEICNVGDHRVVAGLHTIACRPKKEFAKGWLGFFINSSSYHDQLLPLITGIKVSSVSKSAFRQTKILLPPLPEQRKIAVALSDVDEMIAALEKLIEKKRKIKTGAMQRLLTGKTRLPGFKGAWVEKRLGELSDIMTGATPSTNVAAYWGGDIRWMSSGEVHLKYVKDVVGRITRQGFDSASTCMLPAKTVLIALAGQGKTRGTVAISLIPLCTNQSIAGIVPSSLFNSDFLYHCLDARYEDLRMISSGDGSRGGLSKQILSDYVVNIPPTLAEQKAIAKVLGDMDEEIAALEAELAKTRQLKQGMMQELLTGKTRLVQGG